MPVKRRVSHRETLTFGELQELAHGAVLLGGYDVTGFAGDDSRMREAWAVHGERLTAAWVARDHATVPIGNAGGQGTRPWGWWRFDAPEQRRILAPLPARRGPVDPEAWRRHHGLPCRMTRADEDRHVERQRDYLDRLGLLTDAERAALEATR
jgi:hypothetical protein